MQHLQDDVSTDTPPTRKHLSSPSNRSTSIQERTCLVNEGQHQRVQLFAQKTEACNDLIAEHANATTEIEQTMYGCHP